MGWAARANHSAEISKAFKHRKPENRPGGSIGPTMVLADRRQVRQAAISALLRAFGAGDKAQTPASPRLPENAGEILQGTGGRDGR